MNDIPKKSPLILKSGTRTVDPILKLLDDLHNFPDELSRAKIKTNDNDQKPKNTQYFLTTAVPIINNQLPIIAEHISSNKALSFTTTQATTTKIKQTTTSATTPTPSSSAAATTIATSSSLTSSKRRIESFGPADFLRLCFQEGIGCDFSLKRNLNKHEKISPTTEAPTTTTTTTEKESNVFKDILNLKVKMCVLHGVCDNVNDFRDTIKPFTTTTTTAVPTTTKRNNDAEMLRLRVKMCFLHGICDNNSHDIEIENRDTTDRSDNKTVVDAKLARQPREKSAKIKTQTKQISNSNSKESASARIRACFLEGRCS